MKLSKDQLKKVRAAAAKEAAKSAEGVTARMQAEADITRRAYDIYAKARKAARAGHGKKLSWSDAVAQATKPAATAAHVRGDGKIPLHPAAQQEHQHPKASASKSGETS